MKPPQELAVLSKAREWLDKATNINDIRDIMDKAEALRMYYQKAAYGLGVQNQAAEIKIRAERRAGELLSEMDRAGVGRPKKNGITTIPLTLPSLGIGKGLAKGWRETAKIPSQDFEQFIAESIASKRELTSLGVRKLAKKLSAKEPGDSDLVLPDDCEIVSSLSELDGRSFATVYADPPWQYGNQGTRAATSDHYQTMSVDEICNEPVRNLVADDALLHLWTTNAFLPDAFDVIDAWGFTYKSCLVWVKPQLGIGNYWRVSHEFLLLGVRGKGRFRNTNMKSWLEHDRLKHSQKPMEFRRLVETVSSPDFLELYGRRPISGWVVYGNQIDRELF